MPAQSHYVILFHYLKQYFLFNFYLHVYWLPQLLEGKVPENRNPVFLTCLSSGKSKRFWKSDILSNSDSLILLTMQA